MADSSGVDYDSYSAETLAASFLEARDRLSEMRRALLSKGYWIDAKYEITEVAKLEDSHIMSIIKMMKNKAILKARRWKGLEDREWEDFLRDEPAYPYLFSEALDRNLPGSGSLPSPVA